MLSITIVDWVFAYMSSIPLLPEQLSIHFDIRPVADFWSSAAEQLVFVSGITAGAETAHTVPRTAAVMKNFILMLLPSILLTVSEAGSSINEGLSVHILSNYSVQDIIMGENCCRVALLTKNEHSTYF